MYPVLFHLGPFTFYSFGLLAALALIVPAYFVWRLLRTRGVPGEFCYELIFAAGIGGFAGARIYWIVQHWSEASKDLLQLPRRRLRPDLVRRPHRRLHRRRRLEPDTQAEGRPRRQRHGAGRRPRLRHRARRLPALGRRRLRQAERPPVGDGLPQRHGADAAGRARPADADLRDPHHGADLPRPVPHGEEAPAGLVRVRLVPGAVGRRALPHRVPAPQPGVAARL